MTPNPELFLLRCRVCSPDGTPYPIDMPFATASSRAEWKTSHTQATGHTLYATWSGSGPRTYALVCEQCPQSDNTWDFTTPAARTTYRHTHTHDTGHTTYTHTPGGPE